MGKFSFHARKHRLIAEIRQRKVDPLVVKSAQADGFQDFIAVEGRLDIAGMRFAVIVKPVGILSIVGSLNLFFLVMISAGFLAGDKFSLCSFAAFSPEAVGLRVSIPVGSP